ncbi:hypothetical protein VTK73DRAFT_5517 [Phialemonium thermophilum]|uniref:C2H2-type domain-containing protein n=1 Tax=Phialemonium thermophilum TaxID=223376 RepID=A0ABR3WNQ0_9PEZI
MSSDNGVHYQVVARTSAVDAPTSVTKRRRRTGGLPAPKACAHCGRTFKRTEHLERHVRTHTKEKPFICHCGAAFTRRDLLTRHQRIALHEDGASNDEPADASTAGSAPASSAPSPNGGTGAGTGAGATGYRANYYGQAQQHRQESWTAAAGTPEPNPGLTQSTRLSTGTPGFGMSSREPTNQWPHQLYELGSRNDVADVHQPFQNVMLTTPYFNGAQQDTIGLGFDTHFREFAGFLDGMGLPAEWSPYFDGPEKDGHLDASPKDTGSSSSFAGGPSRLSDRPGTPFISWLPSAPSKDHISRDLAETAPVRAVEPEAQPFRVTDEQRGRLLATMEGFRDIVGTDFRFPSRHALTRYITSFFEGFHSHMPFIHGPTWRISKHSIELILAMSAIGCQYCFEHKNSERLFHAGKAILVERIRQHRDRFGPRTLSLLSLHEGGARQRQGEDEANPSSGSRNWDPWEPIETIRALVLLMGYATWEPKVSLVQEAFTLQSLLAQVLRDIGLSEEDESDFAYDHGEPQAAWLTWVAHESVRRAKLISFSFLHIHSIAYNVYPVLRSNEIRLRLPSSTREWKASNATQWLKARQETAKEQLGFQDALAMLLRKSEGASPLDPIPTPLGNYLLLHGLLQRIYIVRDLTAPVLDHVASLPQEETDKLESGLRSWTLGWQQAHESSLDPNNENGPIPFTSSSLLGLAYARIYLHLGPYRQLETRNPKMIAEAISRSPNVDRSDGVISALLYSVHMLSIPVRLGVDRVARSQAFFWSVRHSLAGLECAVLLSKWLFSLSRSITITPMTESEDRILHWVWCIIEEAALTVEFHDDELEVVRMPVERRELTSLALAVLMVWAHFFKSNTQWPFINIIGKSLQEYGNLLRSGK